MVLLSAILPRCFHYAEDIDFLSSPVLVLAGILMLEALHYLKVGYAWGGTTGVEIYKYL